MRCGVALLVLMVLRTKVQNGFCPMCAKECHAVLNRSIPFWGQFWGQICETDCHTQRSNKCAVLVSLRIWDTSLTRCSRRKSPTNQYISFTLHQEVVRTPYSTPSPHTAPSPRETSLFGRVHTASTRCPSSQTPPQIPRFPGIFDFTKTGFSCAGFACTGKSRTNKY